VGSYDLYLGGAVVAQVAGIIGHLGRTKEFLLILFSMSSILLFALSAAGFNPLVCTAAVLCFVTFNLAVMLLRE